MLGGGGAEIAEEWRGSYPFSVPKGTQGSILSFLIRLPYSAPRKHWDIS